MQQPDKIIIADDHPLFRQALMTVLAANYPGVNLIEADTIVELERLLTRHTDVDLLLLDLNIPKAHGFNTLIGIRNNYPQMGTIVISGQEDQDTIQRSMAYGAAGFVPKSTPVPEMIQAINCVLDGKQWLPEGLTYSGALDDAGMSGKIASLSPRQHKILMMFADGLLNKQIAYELGLSEATIKAHASAIFLKLGVHTRTQAVIAMNQLQLDQSAFAQQD